MNNAADTIARLQSGDFRALGDLKAMLADDGIDKAFDCRHIFAHACGHEGVADLDRAFDAVSEFGSFRRLVTCLGLTLSPAAIPVLLRRSLELESEEIDDYAVMAIGTVGPFAHLEPDVLRSPDFRSRCEVWAAEAGSSGQYFYEGEPVFPGDITKQLVTAALVANREGKGAAIVYQGRLLSAFSGERCPVGPTQIVDPQTLEETFAYVKRIAAMEWERGAKYFFRRKVE